MENISVAVVGAGIAGNFHCNALKQVYCTRVRLKTIVDVDTERAYDLLEKWGFQNATADYESVLQDPEIDLVCIALPTVLHADFAIKALNADKHVICEKPLTGYFGLPEEGFPAENTASKRKMCDSLLKDMSALRQAIDKSKAKFLYAETYMCFPNCASIAESVRTLNVRVLDIAVECSIHGSERDLIELRKHVGDSSLMRVAAYPLSSMLFGKQLEARIHDEDIYATSVSAEMGQKRADNSACAENFVNIAVTFSDGCKGVVYSCDKSYYDHTQGRMRNWIKSSFDNGYNSQNTITPADNVKLYFLGQEGYESAWRQTDWFNKYDADEAYNKYIIELNRFIGRVVKNRQGSSGFSHAYDCVKIIHAAYLSAEEGRCIYPTGNARQ